MISEIAKKFLHKKRMRQLLLITILLLSFSPSFSQKKTSANLTLFEIDSKPVTVDEFVYLYKKNHQGRTEEFTKEKIEEYLDLFINFKLKVNEAEVRELDHDPEFIKELNSYKEELKKPFIAEVDLLKKLVEQTYDRLREEVKASHILINVGPDASPSDTLKAFNKSLEIRKKIIDGEDFEKLAKEFSEDPSAKMNGGSLGYFSALQMVYPFEEAAFNLEVGEVSPPTRTQFGYHLIKTADRRPTRGEVEVSHILVRGADEKAEAQIKDIYDQLQKGALWDSLCAKYSQDPGTKDNGGRLRPFGTGALASAPKFEEMAFSMEEVGSISKPVLTSFGWHIIRLEKIIPIPPFEELKASLERRVARDERMAISKTIVEQKRRQKYNYQEDHLLEKKLVLLADSSLIEGQWARDKTKVQATDPLFTIGEKKFTIGDFEDFIISTQESSKLKPSAYVHELYDRFVGETLAEVEDRSLQRENPEYKNLVTEYREGILLFNIMEREVWNKASEDSLGQRKFYDENLNKYLADLRVNARIFSTEDKDFRDSVKTKIVNGDSLSKEDIKKFKAVVNFKSYEKGESVAIDLISWTVGLHAVEADGMYYLVEVDKLVPPGQKKFEEVRAGIISDYQDQLEKEWLNKLRAKYPVKVYTKGKKKAIATLTGKEKS